MKTKLLISSLLLSFASAFAAQAQTPVTPDTAAPNKSLPYQPFPMQDPKTGKPVKPEDMVTLGDGRKMKAKDYFQNLNDHEKYLTSRGYTLRDKKANMGVVAEVKSTDKLKRDQLEAIKKQIDASSSSTITLTSGPAGDASKVPTCRDTLPGVNSTQPFTLDFGNRSSAALSVSAVAVFQADCNKVSGRAVGSALGTVFNNSIPIFRGEANGEVSKQGAANLNFSLLLAGKQVLDERRSSPNGITLSKNFKQDLVASVTARAVIVLIPVSFTAGAKGEANLDFSLNATTAMEATGSVTPSMRISAFAEGGVDIFFAKAGVGVSLLLIDISAPTVFNAKLLKINNKFIAQGSFRADSRLRALDGRMFLFAELNLIFFRPRFELDLIKFSGFDVSRNLFTINAEANMSPSIISGTRPGVGGLTPISPIVPVLIGGGR